MYSYERACNKLIQLKIYSNRDHIMNKKGTHMRELTIRLSNKEVFWDRNLLWIRNAFKWKKLQ
jgi:hypothetical protein